MCRGGTPIEFTLDHGPELQRDVSRVTHPLRAFGHKIEEIVLLQHDDVQKSFLETVLGGGLGQQAIRQACLGVTDGGLGYRRANDIGLAASVASRIENRAMVAYVFEQLSASGVHIPSRMRLYDDQTDESAAALLPSFPFRARRNSTPRWKTPLLPAVPNSMPCLPGIGLHLARPLATGTQATGS